MIWGLPTIHLMILVQDVFPTIRKAAEGILWPGGQLDDTGKIVNHENVEYFNLYNVLILLRIGKSLISKKYH